MLQDAVLGGTLCLYLPFFYVCLFSVFMIAYVRTSDPLVCLMYLLLTSLLSFNTLKPFIFVKLCYRVVWNLVYDELSSIFVTWLNCIFSIFLLCMSKGIISLAAIWGLGNVYPYSGCHDNCLVPVLRDKAWHYKTILLGWTYRLTSFYSIWNSKELTNLD